MSLRTLFSFNCALGLTVMSAAAQTIIPIPNFFDPILEAKPQGGSGVLNVAINPTPVTNGPATAGQVTWTHSAGGLVQAGVEVLDDLLPLLPPLASANIELASYTGTTGSGLVFGKELEIETAGVLGLLDGLLDPVVSDVVTADVANTWNSRAVVTGLNLEAGQEYQASFTIAAGNGLNVGLLNAASFTVLDGNTVIPTNAGPSFSLLSLGLGTTPQTAVITFTAPQDLSQIAFNFSANTLASASLFGSSTGNQPVLSFSGFSLASSPIPEPSGVLLTGLAGLGLLARRRRAA